MLSESTFLLSLQCIYPSLLTVIMDKLLYIYTVSQKNDNDVAHYNFNAYKPILVIFCTDVAE